MEMSRRWNELQRLTRDPTHGDRDAGDADQNHLDADEGRFIGFDGLRFHIDYLAGAAASSDAHADMPGLGFAA